MTDRLTDGQTYRRTDIGGSRVAFATENKPTKTQNLQVTSGFLTTYTIPELDLKVASP